MNNALLIADEVACPRHSSSLIDAIGEREFEGELVSALNRICGAEHCAVFVMEGPCLAESTAASLDGTGVAQERAVLYVQGQFWRRDPTMTAALELQNASKLSMFRLDIDGLVDRELRDTVYPQMGDRLLLSGPTAAGRLALSVLKSGRGNIFLDTETAAFKAALPSIWAILGRHTKTKLQQGSLRSALDSLSHIQDYIDTICSNFPLRERQVISRIVYGMSCAGIALDLSIGEETVSTYRKRIYQRLRISTQRELMVWYIASLTSDFGRGAGGVPRAC